MSSFANGLGGAAGMICYVRDAEAWSRRGWSGPTTLTTMKFRMIPGQDLPGDGQVRIAPPGGGMGVLRQK